jgi:DNA (cytosine-5)-methyltransferase 1
LLNSFIFHKKVLSKRRSLEEIKCSDIPLYDIESYPNYFDGELLPKIITKENKFLTAADAINDITSTRYKYYLDEIKNEFALHLATLFKPKFKNCLKEIQNHEQRKHSFKVKARFRLYQTLNNLNGIRQNALQVISGKCDDEKIFERVYLAFKEEALLIESNQTEIFDQPKSLSFFKEYLKLIESKKHSQRAIKSNEPAHAQMTIPDDLCHYSANELRTLTVREMARFQSFPDWFVFRSKVTTGGDQRKFEVPQYTQVGNAVPPLLAFELGNTISNLLKSIELCQDKLE